MTAYWNKSTDVVIIGSGAAGLSAAIEARLAGASVMVFEKMPVMGGNTRISDGGLSAPGNFLQKRSRVADSLEQFCDDILQAGLGHNHPDLVTVFARHAAEAVDWIWSLGVRYADRLDQFGGHSVPRTVTIENNAGHAITKALTARCRELGVAIHTRCTLEHLITGDSKRVSGVCLSCTAPASAGTPDPETTASAGSIRHIRAQKAVVLATGGFGSDVAFRTCQIPRLDASIGTTNHKGATAEGLTAALKIHAMPLHLSWIQLGPWGCADETGYGKGARFASYSVFPAGILVDPDYGTRIVNEWADRRQRSDAILNTGHACIGIVDDQGAKKEPDSLSSCLKTGKIRQFDTLAALGSAYSMPAGSLEQTVADYNTGINQKSPDQFGKLPKKDTAPLDTPPFFAIRLWPKVHYTPGGLHIDTHARVMDLSHHPISGLFAAGEVTGGIHGAGRLGGCALTECIVYGRIAGQNAAATEHNNGHALKGTTK
ncbi:MAG TPA: flavocytochrome c [Desulfotignum sp.]|nr:flavocytochrome c [Desulfotignum sp.]